MGEFLNEYLANEALQCIVVHCMELQWFASENKLDYLGLPSYSRDVSSMMNTCAVTRCTMEMSLMEMFLTEF